MSVFFIFCSILLGIFVGSFINTTVFRTGKQEKLIGKSSKCQSCLTPVTGRDILPIIGYIGLKGRCRQCSSVISWQYPVIELICGLLFGALFWGAAQGVTVPGSENIDWFFAFLRNAIIVTFLLIIFVYDLRYSYILDRFSLPAIIIAVVANLLLGADSLNILLGGFLIGGFFALQFLLSKGEWVGAGDVRMGMLMGFFLGLQYGVLALILSYIIGSIIGILLLIFRKESLKSHVPFGTFMALSIVFVIFFGNSILHWYFGLMG